MKAAIELIPAPVTLIEIEGAGHDLAQYRADVATRVVEEFFENQ